MLQLPSFLSIWRWEDLCCGGKTVNANNKQSKNDPFSTDTFNELLQLIFSLCYLQGFPLLNVTMVTVVWHSFVYITPVLHIGTQMLFRNQYTWRRFSKTCTLKLHGTVIFYQNTNWASFWGHNTNCPATKRRLLNPADALLPFNLQFGFSLITHLFHCFSSYHAPEKKKWWVLV